MLLFVPENCFSASFLKGYVHLLMELRDLPFPSFYYFHKKSQKQRKEISFIPQGGEELFKFRISDGATFPKAEMSKGLKVMCGYNVDPLFRSFNLEE